MSNMIELTPGDVYGDLTVLIRIDSKNYLFRCVCGKEKVIRKLHVFHGVTKSCGCLVHRRFPVTLKNLTGEKFGPRIVIKRGKTKTTPGGQAKTYWTTSVNCAAIYVIFTLEI